MKKFTIVLLVMALAIMGGCSNDGGSGNGDSLVGDGKIMGTIENINTNLGAILPVHVFVIETNPDEITDPSSILDNYIAETTVEADDATYADYSYSISEVPDGEYYVVAYKDLNGNAEIDVSEAGPLDAAGFYGMSETSETAEAVIIEDGETTTGIDFIIGSTADTNIGGNMGSVYDGMTVETIEGAEVELYGTAGIKVAESVSTTNSSGTYSFSSGTIIDGEYYLKVSKNGYLTSITPLFVQVLYTDTTPHMTNSYWSVVSGAQDSRTEIGTGYYPNVYLLTETAAADYGYTSGSALIAAGVPETVGSGAVGILNPESGTIHYLDDTGLNIDDTLTATSSSGWFVIDGVAAGDDYTITANHDTYNFYEHKLIVEENTYLQVEIVSTDLPM